MKRRDFFEDGLVAGAAVAAAVTFPKSAHSGSKKPAEGKMYVRTQGFRSTDEDLKFLQRCGVRHKSGSFPFIPGKGWNIDDIRGEIDQCDKFGIKLDMTSLPIYENLPNVIFYGKSPERDREIDLVCDMIRTAAKAGVDSLRYNTCILPIDRTEREPGRGGNVHTAFRLEKMTKEEQSKLSKAGRVSTEMHWERISYLLDRMIPVANEYKVRMGNSQEDPATPAGYKGVDKVLNDFEGMKKFIEIQRSPYHGWNFCVGSVA
ncbi:MAG: mannonate dehydratase, partial [Candidatus Latescibacterota bacterium]